MAPTYHELAMLMDHVRQESVSRDCCGDIPLRNVLVRRGWLVLCIEGYTTITVDGLKVLYQYQWRYRMWRVYRFLKDLKSVVRSLYTLANLSDEEAKVLGAHSQLPLPDTTLGRGL